MGKGKEKEDRSHRQGHSGASGNPPAGYAQQPLYYHPQQYSSQPAASGHQIPQPRPAPYQQGQLWGDTSYSTGYTGTAQYSSSLTGEPQPLYGGYSASPQQQTTQEHKITRESSSSSGDQQPEHERSHRKHGGSTHKHKKPDHGSGEHHHSRRHDSQRGESHSEGQSHHDPRYQSGSQGANVQRAAPQYQQGPWQNTGWSTNAPATAAYGGGGGGGNGRGSVPQPAGGGRHSYGDDMPVPQSNLPAGLFLLGLPPMRTDGELVLDPIVRPQPQPDQRLPPMQAPEPPGPAAGTGEVRQGTGPATSQFASVDLTTPNFNVSWRGNTFAVEPSAMYNHWSHTQVREARVLVASFANWEEVEEMGQPIPGGRANRTVVHLLRNQDAQQWGLQKWREWTGAEDKTLWENRAQYPGEDIVAFATRIQPLFPGRLVGELVGRLKLFARMNKHPDRMGRTIGAFPTMRLDKRRANR
ncbi:hypothetical protein F5883DRAFT_696974 [Diaporthe sp. PMI_573]|nr:hypothetical protein F5883DRAFT_696974 [Diaporthaceae sp. PMI_573]